MANNIHSKSQRKALKPRREPYWSRISTGLFIGYRALSDGEGTWIARSRTDDGKQKYQSIGALDPEKAYDEAVKQAQAWAKNQDQGISNYGSTVEDACSAYIEHIKQHKSQSTAKDAQGRFRRLINGTPLARVKLDRLKAAQVRKWLNDQVPDKAPPEQIRKAKDSANRNLATLKAALNQALKDSMVATDTGWRTVEKFKEVGKRRDRLLTKQERQAILDHARPDLADFVRAMLYTFARPGELASADVGDFDKAQGALTLSGKTGTRTVTLSTAAIGFFTEHTKGKLPTAPLLARNDGGRWRKEIWRKYFRQAAEAAGLPSEIVLYHIRHAAVSEAIAAGMDSFLVAKLAGTSTAMIDKHYGHLRHDVTRARLDAMGVL